MRTPLHSVWANPGLVVSLSSFAVGPAPLPQCPGTDRVLPVPGGGEAAAMDTQVPPCWVLAAVEDGAECCPSPPHTPCRCSQPPRGTSPPSHQALPPPAQPHLGTSRSSPLSG